MGNRIEWTEELEKQLCTPEEMMENRIQVELMSALVEARKEKGISQRELEELSGVAQSAIARMEKGNVNPTLDTLVKILTPLGKKLSIVPITE